jgi:natural product precursor
MKKVKFLGKLSLNKVTVAKLNNDQMCGVVGGQMPIYTATPCRPTTTVQTNNTCGMMCTY